MNQKRDLCPAAYIEPEDNYYPRTDRTPVIVDQISPDPSEKVKCECGAVVRSDGLTGHKKTARHRGEWNSSNSYLRTHDDDGNPVQPKQVEKVECECGKVISANNLHSHYHTRGHQQALHAQGKPIFVYLRGKKYSVRAEGGRFLLGDLVD